MSARIGTALGKLQLKATNILKAPSVRRAAEKHSEVLDRAMQPCCVLEAGLRIVMSSIIRRRNGLVASSVMEVLLS
jgi:hypothetical protein